MIDELALNDASINPNRLCFKHKFFSIVDFSIFEFACHFLESSSKQVLFMLQLHAYDM